MSNEKMTIKDNTIVTLDRIKLNYLIATMNNEDSRMIIAQKVLKRAIRIEKKNNAPCMEVPIRTSELKKLFPNGSDNPPL